MATISQSPMPTQEPESPMEGNYYVAAYPPFSCWTPDKTSAVREMLQTPPEAPEPPLGIYFHIPFCSERCDYCYFRAYSAMSTGQIGRYLEGLVQELDYYRNTPRLADRALSFVYFGGGTPSLLTASQIRWLLGEVQATFPWDAVREVTFECAPKSVTRQKLYLLRQAGVTRISLGVQQLDDRVLSANGRTHSVKEVERAWDSIQAMEFPTLNIDLIVGLLDETDMSFHASLSRVIARKPDSVTIYQLELPRNTPLAHRYREGMLGDALPPWDVKRRRLGEAFAALEEAGYTIQTSYTALRDPKRHLFVYQDAQYRGADMVGMGASSFSYVGGIHFQNVDTSSSYLALVASGRFPIQRAHVLTSDERMVREFVLQMKLGGVRRSDFRAKFAVDVVERFARPLAELAERQWLTVNEDSVRPTREGRLRVDEFLSKFYLPEHREVSYW